MPNLTTPFLNLKGQDINADMKKINEWSVSLIDELKTILCNLDSGNVLEAAKIKAQNIDVAQARIKGAQIQSLTADKLTAGTIDTEDITISNSDGTGSIEMAKQCIILREGNVERIVIGKVDGKYIFLVQNGDVDNPQGIHMDENGEVYITGAIQTDKDCRIQGALRVGLSGDNTKGIEFYGEGYSNGAVCYAKIIPVTDAHTGEAAGISVTDGDLFIGSYPVATVEDINTLNAKIEEVKNDLQTHLNSVQ